MTDITHVQIGNWCNVLILHNNLKQIELRVEIFGFDDISLEYT